MNPKGEISMRSRRVTSEATMGGYPAVEIQGASGPERVIVCPLGEVFEYDLNLYGACATSESAASHIERLLGEKDDFRLPGGAKPFRFARNGVLLAEVVQILGGALSGGGVGNA